MREKGNDFSQRKLFGVAGWWLAGPPRRAGSEWALIWERRAHLAACGDDRAMVAAAATEARACPVLCSAIFTPVVDSSPLHTESWRFGATPQTVDADKLRERCVRLGAPSARADACETDDNIYLVLRARDAGSGARCRLCDFGCCDDLLMHRTRDDAKAQMVRDVIQVVGRFRQARNRGRSAAPGPGRRAPNSTSTEQRRAA